MELHLSYFSENLLKPVFLLVRFENVVLNEAYSLLMVSKVSLVIQKHLFVLYSLLDNRSNEVLHGLSHLGLKYELVSFLVFAFQSELVSGIKDSLGYHLSYLKYRSVVSLSPLFAPRASCNSQL